MSLAILKSKVKQLIEKAQNYTWIDKMYKYNQPSNFDSTNTPIETYDLVFPDGMTRTPPLQMVSNPTLGSVGLVGAERSIVGNDIELNLIMNCSGLKALERIYLPKCEICNSFANTTSLKEVTIGKCSQKFNINAFQNCTNLERFKIAKGFEQSITVSKSEKIRADDLNQCAEDYADMTGKTSPTFFVGGVNAAKMSPDALALLTAKNIAYK